MLGLGNSRVVPHARRLEVVDGEQNFLLLGGRTSTRTTHPELKIILRTADLAKFAD